MRIAIDAKPILKKTKTGIGIYTQNIINAFSEIGKEDQFFLYSRLKPFDQKRKPPELPAKNFFNRINYFKLPIRFVLGMDIDVFYTSSYDVKPPKGSRFVLVVHDIIPKAWPYGHTEDVVRNFDKSMKVLDYVDAVITPSERTRDDVIKHYKMDEKKIFAIHSGVDNFYKRVEFSEKEKKEFLLRFNLNDDFLLFVGTIEPRKNLKNLLYAFKEIEGLIPHKLVIAGMKGWMCDEVFSLIRDLALEKKVVMTGYVEKEDLLMFYNLCGIFIYPSFYEGFGFPVLEAFRCKASVITSNTSSLKEIGEGACLLIDPNEPKAIKEAMLTLLNNRELRDELIEKGYKRALEFNWTDTARNTLSVFRKIDTINLK
jgi:glycosyltransferase involved in cell wall biosynthesis